MRILYITHSNDLTYGAAKSLGYLLQNSQHEFDMVCSSYLQAGYGEGSIRAYAGNNLRRLFFARMPNRFDIVLSNKEKKMSDRFLNFLRNIKYDILSVQSVIRIKRIIREGHYDLIHINSITLYPLIDKRYCYIMHAREIYNGRERIRFNHSLNKASGILCISDAVKDSLCYKDSKCFVLNNPFDMTRVSDVNTAKVMKAIFKEITEDPIIFSMVGLISPSKGTDFVIEAFMGVPNKNLRLLIVGSGTKENWDHCTKAAEGDSRIIFTGEVSDMAEIYAITDYVVRADVVFGPGRTVYEGLYSGCGVIMQGTSEDIRGIAEGDQFADRILFYNAREQNAFRECLQLAARNKPIKILPRENIEEYMRQYYQYTQEIVNGFFKSSK